MLRLYLLALTISLAAGVPHMPRKLSKGELPKLPRIVGGTEATPGEFPHQISMQREGLFGLSHMCGGSIYDTTNIITAAHCTTGQAASNIYVVAGEYSLSIDSGDEQTVQVSGFVEHEDYDADAYLNDISLMKLSSALEYTSMVASIELPGQGEVVEAGTMCTTTGWGTTTEGGYIPDLLFKVDVPIVSDEDCRVSYGESEIADSMLCAGYPDGGKDACQGDSGGPFVCGGKLHGITSWGYGCARPNFPGIYTEVAYFTEWVQSRV